MGDPTATNRKFATDTPEGVFEIERAVGQVKSGVSAIIPVGSRYYTPFRLRDSRVSYCSCINQDRMSRPSGKFRIIQLLPNIGI